MLALDRTPTFLWIIYLVIFGLSCGIIISHTAVLSSATEATDTPNNNVNTNADTSSDILTWFQFMFPAIIAAIASVVAAIIAARNQNKLKKLEEWRAEQDARRDYEYEARKRLYRELEPLIFLHVEDSDVAYHHILELADMARSGTLNTAFAKSMDNKEENYYLKATAYKLIRPMAVFRLMQRQLTSYDLQLENYFRAQYTLAKCLYFSCADDYYVALGGREEADDKSCLLCAFHGFLKHPEEKKEKSWHPNHIVYNILGITRGRIDSLANSLVRFDENDKLYRVMSFDEFEREHLDEHGSKATPSILKLFELFTLMNVDNRDNYPKYVLIWRILLLHACVYSIMKKLVNQKHLDKQQDFTGENYVNMIDREAIKKHGEDFLKNEVYRFRWVIENEKKLNPEISRERMEKDYSRSVIAIRKYLDYWLRENFENPSIPVRKKKKFIFNLSNLDNQKQTT